MVRTRVLGLLTALLVAGLAAPGAALAAADVGITTFSDSADPLGEEASVVYTLSVTNTGPDPATDLTETVVAPADIYTLQGANAPAGGGVNASGNTVTYTLPTLASGATATATSTWKGDHPGTAVTTAEVTSSSSDPNSANNSASQQTVVSGLSVTGNAFRDQAVGTLGPVQTVTVTNGSSQSVTLPPSAFSGDTFDFFDIDGCTDTSLAVGATCEVPARFAPSAEGDRSITKTLAPSASSVDPLTVTLSGRGVAPPTVAGPQGPEGPEGPQGAQGPKGDPAFKLVVVPVAKRLKVRDGRRVTFAYVSTLPARVRLDVRKGSRTVKSLRGRAKVGGNRLRWNGKLKGKTAPPGSYKLKLTAVNGSQTAVARAKLKLTRR